MAYVFPKTEYRYRISTDTESPLIINVDEGVGKLQTSYNADG